MISEILETLNILDIANEQGYPTPYAASPLLPLLLFSLTLQKHSPTTKPTFNKEYDFVIVGAGSSGSALAARLSEIPCVTVLLLEAGKTPPKLTDIPAISRSFAGTDIDWAYLTTPQTHTGAGHVDRRIPWLSGKMVGGSSVLNDMIYTRGNRLNFDGWAEQGATGWSYADVLPYFKKLEDNADPDIAINTEYHSTGGPITVTRPKYNPKKKQAAVQAVKNLGYKFVDPNAENQIGFYDYQAYTRKGRVCSAAKGYLVPNERRQNLHIVANAMVRKVLIEGGKATGVEFDFKNSTHTVKAKREVILSAGTTNTAQLLMLSGIGPKSELEYFKIEVKADLPVGLNLQEDAAIPLIYRVDDDVSVFGKEIRKDSNIFEYSVSNTGPLQVPGGFHLVALLNDSGPDTQIPDYILYIADLDSTIATQLGFTQEVLEKVFLQLANASLLFCAVQEVHPLSTGTVKLGSADPYAPPVIDPNYFAVPQDIEDVVQGMKACERFMSDSAMKEINTRPIEQIIPGCENSTSDNDTYFRCIVRTIMITTNHQIGTAKMGDPKDPSTVVDPNLRVKGIKCLRVVDASIMPTIPWGNPNAAAYMIGEKGADIIKADHNLTDPKLCNYANNAIHKKHSFF